MTFIWGILKSETPRIPSISMYEPKVVVGRKNFEFFSDRLEISGEHFKIKHVKTETESFFFIEDISSNGTFLNKEPFRQAKLRHYDSISMLHPSCSNCVKFMFIDTAIAKREMDRRSVEVMYEIGEYCGSGSFAIVRKGRHRLTNQVVAIKIIHLDGVKDVFENYRTLGNEIRILSTLNHPNIVHMESFFFTEDFYYIVLEYLAGGDLLSRINNKLVNDADLPVIFRQILNALKYLSLHNIIHRDLKPENILFIAPNSVELKLTDFGLSRKIDGRSHLATTVCGTSLYVAPEVISGSPYDASRIDVWSAGVVFFVTACGYIPFPEVDHQKLSNYDRKVQFHSDWKERNPLLRDLITRMLVVDVPKRFTVDQCITHPYFHS